MLMLTTVLGVVVLPMTALAAVLLVVGRMERAREARVARQVDVTDAIHRELGAVVAPVVKRRIGGGWRVEIAVPFESPAIVGRVVAIAHAAILRSEPGQPSPSMVGVVLTAQEPQVRPMSARTRSLAGMSPLTTSEREVKAWTGTTTSCAS